jgi:PAS domain S-box-containing protein
MFTLRDISIKHKLMIIVMATTAAALVLAGIGVFVSDSILFRRSLERDLTTLASIIAENSTAAIDFKDPESAEQTLAALRARTHIISACIYSEKGGGAKGMLVASYSRADAVHECAEPNPGGEFLYTKRELTVSHPILLNGKRIGTLVMLDDLDEIRDRMKSYGATILAVLLFSSFIAFLLSSRLQAVISDPISHLVQATRSVAETNDYGIRARKLSGDELGTLVDRFNEMLAGIQSRDSNLRKALRDREEALGEAERARERFRFMAESMPQKIFTAAPNGEVDYFNRQWMDFTGLSFEEIKGWGWTQFVHPDDLADNLSGWRHSIETGEPYLSEHRIRRADGVYRWHLSRVHPMRDAQGEISIWIGSNTDIHEQKEKEAELRRANEDLQQFAYSASHDLQEPVRNVAVYSELVARRYHSLLDEDGRQFLGFLSESGRRLATLIADLLAYTKAGAVEGDVSTVDSAVVLKHTLSSLSEAIRESGASVTYEWLPEVRMGESHLQQVFLNLIGNAVKYRNAEKVRIHISATEHGASWRFAVADNGIGIDPQYREKIFGVFKRLHRDQKYSGTGIGLAI